MTTNSPDTYLAREAATDGRLAIDWLKELDTIKQALAVTRAREAQLVEKLKQYMALEGLVRLDYEELGIAAVIQKRESTDWDVISYAAQHPEWLAAIAAAGALKVDGKVVKALRGKRVEIDGLTRFEMNGETEALVIERAKSGGAQ